MDKRTRPTSDLTRESVFNLLGDEVPGSIAVDLFAGTGSMGLEALSRGATQAYFVDISRENVDLIRRNVKSLSFEGQAKVSCTDAYRFIKTFEFSTDTPIMVFVDPPYREYDNHPERVQQLLAKLWERLPERSAVVLESSDKQEKEWPASGEPWVWDVRHYGGTQIRIGWKEPQPIVDGASSEGEQNELS